MQAKLVAVLVVGAAAAAVGGAVFAFGGSGKSADSQPAPVPTPPAPQPVAEDTGTPVSPFDTAPGDNGMMARFGGGRGDMGDWEARLQQFDWGEFQRLSPEERRARMQAMRAEIEAQMDTNGDGVVDEDERLDAMLASPMGRRILDRFDTNGDGALDEAERQAMREEEARRRAEQEARMLERWDRDGDGSLSREERRAMEQEQRRRQEEQMRRMAAEFDQDGDGELNADEQARAWQVVRERREIDSFVRRHDSNGDGVINTVDLNAFLQLYQSGDRRADVNNDGVVDALDVTAFRDMMNRSANRP